MIAILAVSVAPLLAAYAMLPRSVLGAWPALAIALVPVLAGLGYGVVLALSEPFEDALLDHDAVTWLRRAIERHGLSASLRVAALDERELGNFYHPRSGTIVLERKLQHAHTARAHAIAAHELGHARFHLAHPTASRVLLWCRGAAPACHGLAVGLLAGVALVGGAAATSLAAALLAIAAATMVLVVVDEVIASRSALRELGSLPPAQRAAARRRLLFALGSYAIQVAALAAPLFVWPAIVAHLGPGVAPAEPLGRGAHVVAILAAALLVLGTLIAITRVVPRGGGPAAMLVALLAWLVAPLFVVLVIAQPAALAHRWTAVLAVAAVWPLLTLPVWLGVAAMSRLVGGDLHSLFAAPPGLGRLPGSASLARISRRDLAAHDPDGGIAARLWLWRGLLLVVPLALASLPTQWWQ